MAGLPGYDSEMLRGEKVGLRARRDSDVPVLDAGLHDDVATWVRSDNRAWRPIPPGSPASPYTPAAPSDGIAMFSVVRLAAGPDDNGDQAADGELVGDGVLWRIDTFNRSAHIGIALLPAFRGQGLGTDVVRVLCYYGFSILGLHRLQIETLSDNAAMIAAAQRAGFVREGTLRNSGWVNGTFADDAIFGLLAPEWRALRAP